MIDNKLGITDSRELALTEERISKRRAAELFDGGWRDLPKVGTFASLSAIHRQLFGDIYDFAGEIRTVNIAKGGFRFAPVIYLRSALESIERMPQSAFDEIVEKYVEMNVAHPFREGNGRAMRIWLDLMLSDALGVVADWSRVDKDDYLFAMERSPVRDVEIKTILKNALTDRIGDREVFMKGVDNSYRYEGYDAYKTIDIIRS